MKDCFYYMGSQALGSILEAVMNGVFFNQDTISLMVIQRVRFTASVTFARYAELQKMIENCDSLTDIDGQWFF